MNFRHLVPKIPDGEKTHVAATSLPTMWEGSDERTQEGKERARKCPGLGGAAGEVLVRLARLAGRPVDWRAFADAVPGVESVRVN